jgi:Protein of unknown function (DUF4244)
MTSDLASAQTGELRYAGFVPFGSPPVGTYRLFAAQRPSPRRLGERGMVSAEWAVGLIAAIAIAGVLVAIVTSGAVKQALLNIILQVIGWMAIHFPS